ncbi:YkvA family protein [Peptococcaceae bacterium 1198_IL3148]
MTNIDITPVLKRLSLYGQLTYDIFKTLKLTKRQKLILGAGLAYFVSPIDIIPGFIPILGQLDDIIVALTVLVKILKELSPENRNTYLDKFQLTLEMIENDLEMAKELAGQLAKKAVLSSGRLVHSGGKAAFKLASWGIGTVTRGAMALKGKYKCGGK